MAHTAYPRFGLFNTEERILHSQVVGQDYQIGVWFPFSYRASEWNYPVLYVLDGEFAFGMATGLIATLIGMEEVPEMLVVGIAYHGISSWQEHSDLRNLDFLPGIYQEHPEDTRLPQFTRFFQQELFPLIEVEYRGAADDRGIFGFSSAGFFALHCLLSQPGMFRRTIAASCTWRRGTDFLLNLLPDPAQPFSPADLFLALGSNEEELLPDFERLTEGLKQRHDPNLRISTAIYEGEGHSSGVLAKTFLQGVRTVYR